MATDLLPWPDKDPDETVLYGIDFVDRLDAGVTLAGVSWAVSPSGLTKSAEVTDGATKAFVKLAGGALGDAYEATATVTTSDGQTLQQTATLRIRGR